MKQHSNVETQLKYLPMLRDAVKKGNANAGDLALLEDRVALRQNKKQIYGSQIGWNKETEQYYVFPIVNPEKVDERRAGVGLRPLSKYLDHWDLNWDIEEHKKQTQR